MQVTDLENVMGKWGWKSTCAYLLYFMRAQKSEMLKMSKIYKNDLEKRYVYLKILYICNVIGIAGQA